MTSRPARCEFYAGTGPYEACAATNSRFHPRLIRRARTSIMRLPDRKMPARYSRRMPASQRTGPHNYRISHFRNWYALANEPKMKHKLNIARHTAYMVYFMHSSSFSASPPTIQHSQSCKYSDTDRRMSTRIVHAIVVMISST